MTVDFQLRTDWLRAHATTAHYFGLGFVQVKLDDRRRVHFYHPDVPAFVEEPHDHRYGFVSRVLRGSLVNRVFRLVPGDSHEVSYESCRQGGPETPPGFRSGLEQVGEFAVHEGSGYHVHPEAFHTVHPETPTVTFLERELPSKEFARVVRPAGAPAVCPFSRPMPEDEVWRIVDDCVRRA